MAGEMRVGANEIPRRKSLPRGQLMINGKWRDAGDGATMPTSDPTTEQVITEVAKGSAADLDKAVRAAASALRKILGPCCTMRLVPSFCSVWLIYLTTEPMSSPFARPWIWACPTAIPQYHHATLLRLVSLLWWTGDEWHERNLSNLL